MLSEAPLLADRLILECAAARPVMLSVSIGTVGIMTCSVSIGTFMISTVTCDIGPVDIVMCSMMLECRAENLHGALVCSAQFVSWTTAQGHTLRMSSTVQIFGWPIRGRAEVVRLICAVKGVPFDVIAPDSMKTNLEHYCFGQAVRPWAI